MTEQPAGGGTVPGPQQQHESPIEHLEGWFRSREGQQDAGAAVIVAGQLEPVLRSHFSGVFALLARVMADPELKALEPDVLALAQTALRVVGIGVL